MVLSIETALPHPRRGFIKLEDTVAVTETGWQAFGDFGRGWNRGGTRLRRHIRPMPSGCSSSAVACRRSPPSASG